MTETFHQILDYLSGLRRFRWHGVIVAWLVALVGFAGVLAIPSTYQVKASVFVDSETLLKPLLSGLAIGSDLMTRANLVSNALLSRPNLTKVAREADPSLSDASQAALEERVDRLARRIQIRATGNNIFMISYDDGDRQAAHRVVSTLLNTFMEDTLGIKREDTVASQNFLETQLKEYESRLNEAEQKLADFKKRNVGLMPGQGGDYYARLQTEVMALEDLQSKARVVQQKHNELARQIEGEEPSFGLMTATGPVSAGSTLDTGISTYKRQLETLLLKYTDLHPQVIALRETIEQLEAQRDAAAAAKGGGRPAGPQGTLAMNPVYQSMKIELSKTDVELAELKTRIGDQSRIVGELRQRVNTIPEVESELTRLNRDYEVNRTQYSQLLQRLESARLGQQADESTGKVKFRVVEPPAVPLLPVWPNRPLLLSGVLVLAIGAGVFFALLLHMIKPVFNTRRMLESGLGLPVLGSVTLFESVAAPRRWRDRNIAVLASLGGLVGVYVVAIGVARFLTTSA